MCAAARLQPPRWLGLSEGAGEEEVTLPTGAGQAFSVQPGPEDLRPWGLLCFSTEMGWEKFLPELLPHWPLIQQEKEPWLCSGLEPGLTSAAAPLLTEPAVAELSPSSQSLTHLKLEHPF